eukprot:gene12443-8532_t
MFSMKDLGAYLIRQTIIDLMFFDKGKKRRKEEKKKEKKHILVKLHIVILGDIGKMHFFVFMEVAAGNRRRIYPQAAINRSPKLKRISLPSLE